MRPLIAALLLLLALPVRADFTLGLTAPAWAGFDEGVAAYQRGDYAAALREWRPLAEHGDAEAQFRLGQMYHGGEGVPQDYAEAAKWYRKAAEQGATNGQFGLGSIYKFGLGVPQDYAEAAKWYRKAADQGDALAQYSLGHMYKEGNGVPQDLALAHMWFNLLAGSGKALGRLDRDIVASKMTPAQVAEAQRLAREWMAAFEKRKKK